MMAKKRILSWLVAASLTLSLLPVSALADYEVKVDPGYDIQNHPDYDPAKIEGVLDEQNPDKDPKEDDSISAVIDVIMDKVDQQAIGDTNEAAKDLTDTAAENEQKATDAAGKADELAGALDQIIDAVTKVPEVDAEAAAKDETVKDKDGSAVTNEKGEEVKVLDVQLKENDAGTQVPTVEVEVKVKTDEKGKPVTEQKAIDAFATEKAEAVETAKTEAETAATGAQNALTAAQTAVTNRDQAALDTAKNQAADAYAAANEAAKTAAETYAVAEKVVTDAQAAYDAAVQELTKAGYSLENIQSQLEAAKQAVTDAQTALKSAAAAKAEAEKQRDYAMLYSSLAEAITSEYKYTGEDYNNGTPLSEDALKLFSDALTKLDEAAKKYGTMDYTTEEGMAKFETLAEIIFVFGEQAGGAREDYLQWLNSKDGKKFMEAYTAEKKKIEEWEIDPKDLDHFFPGYKDADGNVVAFWKDENGKDIPLGDGDLIYKMYFLAIQDGVVGTGLVDDVPGNVTYYAKQIREGLKNYLEAEEVLKKVEAGEEVQITLNGETLTYSKNGITDGKGNGLTPENCEAMTGLTWEAYSAGIRSQLQSEMSKQMGDAYNKIFVDKQGTLSKKTCYEWLKTFHTPGAHKELDSFVNYMDLLQYELQFREQDMAYDAAWNLYKGVVDGTDLVNLLLSGYNWETDKLIKQAEEDLKKNPDDKVTQEILEGLKSGTPSEIWIKKLLIYKGALEDPNQMGEYALVYNVVVEHAKAKLEEAQKAAKAADDAVKAYDAAVKAASDAKARLEELLKTTNLNAIKAAEQQLENAQNALTEAEGNRDDALAAQQAAADDYAAAMALAIAAIDPNNPGGGTDTDTGDDGTTALEDALVPLALMPTRGELMNYLYERAGSPAAQAPTFTDVPADHEFAAAIGWAQENGIATGYADGTFDPDNFVVASAMTAFLTRYAVFANMEMPTLTSMAGLEDYDIVDNADEILAEFFGEEYVPAENKNDTVA